MATFYERAPESLRLKYIWLICLLDAQQANVTLQLERDEIHRRNWHAKRPTTRHDALTNAMWAGAMALQDRAREYAHECRDHGHLLFAHQGTTVLQGGAA